jgi:N-acetyl-gamma-glutamyl-phosphate reductase
VQIPLHLDQLPGQPTALELHAALATHYGAIQNSFVCVLPPTENGKLDATALNDTNQLEIRVFGNEKHRHAVLMARLDNLGKGASGAAVENLKLMLGIE